jgi:uncharacterized protein (TIGR02996 family)
MTGLYARPEVLALLAEARERPEDDTPRLVLADWLEEHGDPGRAEFLRLQCRLAPGARPPLSAARRAEAEGRAASLAGRFGGAWAGPLWRWCGSAPDWHRGLLTLRLGRRARVEHLGDVLPWADSLSLEAFGRAGLAFAAGLLSGGSLNHALLELRQPLREALVLGALAGVGESPRLRTLTLWWPRPRGGWRRRLPGGGFFLRLARELAVGRHLTHLAATLPLAEEERHGLLRLGVEPVETSDPRWTRRLPPAAFRGKTPQTGGVGPDPRPTADG